MRVSVIWLIIPALAGCDGPRKVPVSNLGPQAAIVLASHLRAGTREEYATPYLEQHGLKAGMKLGDSFGWSQFFPLTAHCSLGLDFRPKAFKTDGEWTDGLLNAAYIQSNLVNIVYINITNAP